MNCMYLFSQGLLSVPANQILLNLSLNSGLISIIWVSNFSSQGLFSVDI